ncbi:MAG: hypothetical protein GY716_25030 [bacterium]|nr:hypothetical protein [bacterium]
MARGKTSKKATALRAERRPTTAKKLAAFVLERYPFCLTAVADCVKSIAEPARKLAAQQSVERLRSELARRLPRALKFSLPRGLPDAIPGASAAARHDHAVREVCDAVDGFLHRESIAASFTTEERLELLRGMILTRATDNQLKQFFMGSDVRYGGGAFQGKGFRSLGQEAIYGVALRLRRGPGYRTEGGEWSGDVVAPLIRDLGAALAMRPEAEAVRRVLSAQMGKAGPPMDGRDFHIGDFEWGVLPATAPLSISSLSAAGLAMAFKMENGGRVAVAFIGEGGSSLGEWHEAINACAARRLPAIFCIQNNQTALSTPVVEQSAVRVFADKAAGYGIPGFSIDGTDPEAVAAAFSHAAERAREGHGPTLIEVVAMRMCGHAHHDDMLYLGRETPPTWEYPEPTEQGYADAETYAFWRERDPIATYARRLEADGLLAPGDLQQLQEDAETLVAEAARTVVDAPWPEGTDAGARVFADEPARMHVEVLEGRASSKSSGDAQLPSLENGPGFDPKGNTFLEAVMLGVRDALEADPRVFLYGEDVGGKYGNAFLLLRPLLEAHGERIVNSTLAEGGVLGVCIGAALAGMRPIGEIQFNDFVASGFNQLVNNAAKIRYRWGGSAPMVVRLPWGGLRRAGPYHSQNTEPWFYRTPGLKIVAPSTPHDARALMASAVADPDPVLFYEHIGLYRDPKIKQVLGENAPAPLPIGRAALRRAGSDLLIVSYGAYVHRCMRVAARLAGDGIESAVLDLRSIAPLDRAAVLGSARFCGKVLIVHEDSRTGGIGESVAAVIQEEAFEDLDAPVRIVGALDAPVPYAPPLEDYFLPDEERIERAARLLAAY